MKQQRSRKLSRSEQVEAITAAKEGKTAKLAKFYSGHDVGEDCYAIIEFFYCKRCMSMGFLNIRAYLTEEIRGPGYWGYYGY